MLLLRISKQLRTKDATKSCDKVYCEWGLSTSNKQLGLEAEKPAGVYEEIFSEAGCGLSSPITTLIRNPVRLGLVKRAEEYRFSSVRIWNRTPLEDEPLIVDIDKIRWRRGGGAS